MPKITFLRENITTDVSETQDLLTAARDAGVFIEATCGGRGACGKCKVRIASGEVSAPDEQERKRLTDEELEAGIRLACKTFPVTDLTLETLAEMEASVSDKAKVVLPPHFKPELPENTCGVGEPLYGIAFDIGTTTLVGMLWNRTTGKLVGAEAKTNPQRKYGGDVISRIVHAGQSEENCKELQQMVHSALNEITEELCRRHKLDQWEISLITVVGNTTMSHLFMGVDPSPVAQAPYDPVFLGPIETTAGELGLLGAEDAKVVLLSNIAGHVGSDITAVILATDLANREKPVLAIDIGTNGEMVLAGNGRMLACSTAAGPAFEGASIYQGMRGAPGAIDKVEIADGEVKVRTIDNLPAEGICGSGLMDAAAAMLNAGVVDDMGRLLSKEEALEEGIPESLANRLFKDDRGAGFVLSYGEPDIVLLQKDIREIQLAKSAMFTGMELLMRRIGVKQEDLDEILIAGAFGSFIRKESALRIGLIPRIDPARIKTIGNGAGQGVSMALLSETARTQAAALARSVEHIELANDPDFQDEFVDNLMFDEEPNFNK